MYSVRCTCLADGEWEIFLVDEVREWIGGLDGPAHIRMPGWFRRWMRWRREARDWDVDTLHGSSMANLKELRPGTVRILFAFVPWRCSILLVAGDKAGRWNEWYREAIPLAEERYEIHVKERAQRAQGGRS